MRKQIYTEKGVQPGGPYSQAIVAEGPQVFVAGQGPTDPETGELQLSRAGRTDSEEPRHAAGGRG